MSLDINVLKRRRREICGESQAVDIDKTDLEEDLALIVSTELESKELEQKEIEIAERKQELKKVKERFRNLFGKKK